MNQDPCILHDADACDAEREACQWVYNIDENHDVNAGTCISRPQTFLTMSGRHPFELGNAAATAEPILQAFGEILHVLFPALEAENFQKSLKNSGFVNTEWLERSVERHIGIKRSNDWTVIIKDVLNEMMNGICAICLSGHQFLDSVTTNSGCCHMIMHKRCSRLAQSISLTCPMCGHAGNVIAAEVAPEDAVDAAFRVRFDADEAAQDAVNGAVNGALLALLPDERLALVKMLLYMTFAGCLAIEPVAIIIALENTENIRVLIETTWLNAVQPLTAICILVRIYIILVMLTNAHIEYDVLAHEDGFFQRVNRAAREAGIRFIRGQR